MGQAPGASTLGLTDEELLAAFAPYVTRQFEPEDPGWEEIVRPMAQRQASARRRRRWLGFLKGHRGIGRTQRSIRISYSREWSATPVERQITSDYIAPFVFRNRGFEGRVQGEKRVQHRVLFRVAEQLAPSNVLEVGAGNGLNLLTMAARFPGLDLTGLELTTGGVQAAARVRAMPELPSEMIHFSVDPPRDVNHAHRQVSFVQGSGAALPFPDGAFDLVYTVLALEQMEEVRKRALAEISRVSRGHVLMIEPFRDWNASGLRRDYIVANDYFSAAVDDLPAFGLEPICVDEVPSKLAKGSGLVLAKAV